MNLVKKGFIVTLLLSTVLSARLAFGVDPSDPPNTSDYTASEDTAEIPYRTLGPLPISNGSGTTKIVFIESSNPNFVADHARSSSTTDYKIEHIHVQLNYGDDFGGDDAVVSVTEGNSYWEWYYDDFTGVTVGGSPDTQSNCVSFAYHNYKGTSTKCSYWVNSDSPSDKYKNELNEISPSTTDNSDFDTEDGDRCHHELHVWVITKSPDNCAATQLEFKNGPSPTISYFLDPGYSNDCPQYQTGEYYEDDYAIYNKDSR